MRSVEWEADEAAVHTAGDEGDPDP